MIQRVEGIKLGNPLDKETMMGAQASNDPVRENPELPGNRQGRGAPEVLTGGEAYQQQDGALAEGYYIKPTVFRGHNKMAHLPGGNLRPGGSRHHL